MASSRRHGNVPFSSTKYGGISAPWKDLLGTGITIHFEFKKFYDKTRNISFSKLSFKLFLNVPITLKSSQKSSDFRFGNTVLEHGWQNWT
jgi:hypothetical protein